jgi:ABC-2 type transport system permease protein
MIGRTLAIMRKEFMHIVRDPRTLVLIFLIPIIQMTLLGYAATNDIENIALAVLDGDQSADSRALVQAYEATGYFDVTDYVENEKEMAFLLDLVEVHPTVWYNPGLESVNFMIPALMGMILQWMAMLITSMAIVREREVGTMEQLIVTPIRPAELVVGKTAPYILVAFFNLTEVLLISVFWFGVPIQGSVWLLLELSGLFLLGSLGIGILISTAAGTQQEAMLMSFLILLPSIFLSGFFFPLEAMPWVLHVLSYLVPLRYMLIIVRGIVLKGVGLEVLQREVLILSAFCLVMLVQAARSFRKSLD